MDSEVKITLYRHATVLLEFRDRRILIDPQFDEKEAHPPIPDTPNQRRNPLVSLPVTPEEIVCGLDAVVITHLHPDHFDETAKRLLSRDVPVICQPEDSKQLREFGFRAWPIYSRIAWAAFNIYRVKGRHGTGAMADSLAPVSGFVFEVPGITHANITDEHSNYDEFGNPLLGGGIYLAGDTVWYDEVEKTIAKHRPKVAIVNAGAAQFLASAPITMTAEDVNEVAARVPTVVAVHMEAINHCILSRSALRAWALPNVHVPADGETITVEL